MTTPAPPTKTLSVQQLRSIGACEDACNALEKKFGEGDVPVTLEACLSVADIVGAAGWEYITSRLVFPLPQSHDTMISSRFAECQEAVSAATETFDAAYEEAHRQLEAAHRQNHAVCRDATDAIEDAYDEALSRLPGRGDDSDPPDAIKAAMCEFAAAADAKRTDAYVNYDEQHAHILSKHEARVATLEHDRNAALATAFYHAFTDTDTTA